MVGLLKGRLWANSSHFESEFICSHTTSFKRLQALYTLPMCIIIVMSNKISRIFFILSVLVIVGCSESLDIQLEPEVDAFLSNDSEKKIHLTPQDKEYGSLNKWLREHRSGWHPTSGRYPGGVYIKSGIHGIQITKTHVILYSTTYPEPRSIYIQKISKDKLSGIINVGK